ncbi:hypothetical protein TNCV_999751 [Trichonephila clavipes]|nr:hypothetical protein TNCV_999751 [Trichonephila clavipes]
MWSPIQYSGCDPRLVTEWVLVRIPKSVEVGRLTAIEVKLLESISEALGVQEEELSPELSSYTGQARVCANIGSSMKDE